VGEKIKSKMIKSLKEKIKEILETKIVRLEDGSYGYLYKGTVSFFLNHFEEWIKHNKVHEKVKTETEKAILAELKELSLEDEAEIISKIKFWKEKLNSERR